MQYKTEYGTLIVGKFDGVRRRDIWIADRDGQRYCEPAFATGPRDKSNIHNHSIGHGYDPRCSCCYLGFLHTEEAHKQRLARSHTINSVTEVKGGKP